MIICELLFYVVKKRIRAFYLGLNWQIRNFGLFYVLESKYRSMNHKLILFIVFLGSLFSSCGTVKQQKPTKTDKDLKILSYNIGNARGMDDVTDFDRIASIINRINPDCVAIQELDSATQRSNGLVVLDEIAKRTNRIASYNASIDYQGGKYGIGILTKEKPIKTKSVALPGSEEKRSLLIVEMDGYVLCCTHWSLRQPDRMASVAIIDKAVAEFSSKPVFLAGDLNAEFDSSEIKLLSENWQAVNDISAPTIPSNKPNKCIDYIFARKNPLFQIDVTKTKVEQEPLASDHLPVWVSVRISTK